MRHKPGESPAVDVLGNDERPLFFEVDDPAGLGFTAPDARGSVSLRTWARSLSGMQKEAIVINGSTGTAWRLASDEGPYLNGFDAAPCPLSFMTTGMVASYADAVLNIGAAEGLDTRGLRLTLDNYYTMEGSALGGTMIGGALPPELTVELPEALRGYAQAVEEAVLSTPITALVNGTNESLFSLSVNGRPQDVDRVLPVLSERLPDPGDALGRASPSGLDSSLVIIRLKEADEIEGVEGGKGSSLEENQSRVLHVRGVCTVGEDGVKEIIQNLFKPIGSEFRFRVEEAPGFGGQGRAPDAATYMSAGIAFCFMTQFGRYASIVKKDLAGYRIVQDTHFTGDGDPVETHVHVETEEGADFGRTILDMSEQTCFLHALCRTDTQLELKIV